MNSFCQEFTKIILQITVIVVNERLRLKIDLIPDYF